MFWILWTIALLWLLSRCFGGGRGRRELREERAAHARFAADAAKFAVFAHDWQFLTLCRTAERVASALAPNDEVLDPDAFNEHVAPLYRDVIAFPLREDAPPELHRMKVLARNALQREAPERRLRVVH